MKRMYVIGVLFASLCMILAFAAHTKLKPFTQETPSRTELSEQLVVGTRMCGEDIERAKKTPCLKDLAQQIHSAYALDEISKAYWEIRAEEKATISTKNLHTVGHFIGREEYEKTRVFSDAFRNVMLAGHLENSMVHGVMEAYVMDDRYSSMSSAELREELVSHCDALSSRENIPSKLHLAFCVHGIGHTFMFLSGNDLLSSLENCDATGNAEICYSGAFMEELVSSTSEDPYGTEEDALELCGGLEEKYKAQCYRFALDLLRRIPIGEVVYERDLMPDDQLIFWEDNWASRCLDNADAFRSGCAKSLGSNVLAIERVYYDDFKVAVKPEVLVSTKAFCERVGTKTGLKHTMLDCINGVAIALAQETGGINNVVESVMPFCDLFKSDKEARLSCVATAGAMAQRLRADDSAFESQRRDCQILSNAEEIKFCSEEDTARYTNGIFSYVF